MRQQNQPRSRGSLQSRAAATATSLTLRPITYVVPANLAGVKFSRHLVARVMAVLGPAAWGSRFVRVEPGEPDGGPRARGEWVRGPSARREDAVILYIHGSAFAICSSRTHRGITTRLSEQTGLPVFACDYRLAPRHRFPAAADDVRAAYDWLLAEGHDPARIVLAGDSAGGHLAVDLTLELLREGLVPPAALALFSPVLDLSMTLAEGRERMQRDPMISAGRASRLLDLYVVGQDPATRRLSFTFDGVEGFPPTLVQAGGREMLAADAIELARCLTEAGAECELDIWPGQMHVFQALSRLLPEAGEALNEAARFLVDRLEDATRRTRLTLVKEA